MKLHDQSNCTYCVGELHCSTAHQEALAAKDARIADFELQQEMFLNEHDENVRLHTRVEELEAALRDIIEMAREGDAGPHGGTSVLTLLEIAKQVLADKTEGDV